MREKIEDIIRELEDILAIEAESWKVDQDFGDDPPQSEWTPQRWAEFEESLKPYLEMTVTAMVVVDHGLRDLLGKTHLGERRFRLLSGAVSIVGLMRGALENDRSDVGHHMGITIPDVLCVIESFLLPQLRRLQMEAKD